MGRRRAMRRAGRRPGVERLVESDRASGHRVAVHVEQAKNDLAGRGGDARGLRCAGDGEEAYSGRAPKAVNR